MTSAEAARLRFAGGWATQPLLRGSTQPSWVNTKGQSPPKLSFPIASSLTNFVNTHAVTLTSRNGDGFLSFKREGSKRNVPTTTLLTQGTETPHPWPQNWPRAKTGHYHAHAYAAVSLFKAHRCVVPGTVAKMPMVGESFPNERSESPRKLVLLVIALVIFHIGAFVSLYAIFRLYIKILSSAGACLGRVCCDRLRSLVFC